LGATGVKAVRKYVGEIEPSRSKIEAILSIFGMILKRKK
jgi:hypothetical protein